MSWCDKLASTPMVGFKLSPHFAPVTTILDALTPILDGLIDVDKHRFSLEQISTIFSASFNTDDGFKYDISETKISVHFNHRIRYKNVSGGPPIMEMLSKPMPFTSLLPEVSKRLVEATLLLPEIAKRTINRVGVVSTTAISPEDIPPGISRLVEYLGRPWQGELDSFNVTIAAKLASTPEYTDSCMHTLIKPDDKKELWTIQFDWGRVFSSPLPTRKDELERTLGLAQKDALKYFEDLAEGNRFDEVLLRSPTAS